MELKERLDIFMNSGQISTKEFEAFLEIIERFDDFGISLNEENGAMLITHLCVAINRIRNNDLVKDFDSEMYAEIENNKSFHKSKDAFSMIQEILQIQIPDCEKDYIIVHLCALFERE